MFLTNSSTELCREHYLCSTTPIRTKPRIRAVLHVKVEGKAYFARFPIPLAADMPAVPTLRVHHMFILCTSFFS